MSVRMIGFKVLMFICEFKYVVGCTVCTSLLRLSSSYYNGPSAGHSGLVQKRTRSSQDAFQDIPTREDKEIGTVPETD